MKISFSEALTLIDEIQTLASDDLNNWEENFIDSIEHQSGGKYSHLTSAQTASLQKIYEKVTEL